MAYAGRGDPGGEDRREGQHVGQGPAVGGSRQPGEGLGRVERVGQHDQQADQRRRAGGGPDADEDQPVLLEAPARGEAEHHDGGDRGAREGGCGHAPRGGGRDGGHQDHRAERAAAGDAQHGGFGQRVAGDGLHQGSGQRERRAREEGGEHPGCPGVEDEGDGTARPALRPVEHVAQEQLGVAQEDGGDRDTDQGEGEHGDRGEEGGPAADAQPVRRGGAGGVAEPGRHHDQEDRAGEAGDHTGGDGDGGVGVDEQPQQDVRPEDQRGADEARERRARAQPGDAPEPAGERADEGRSAQADEADRAGEGDGGRGEQRRQDHGRDPGGPYRDADAAGGVVAEGEGVDAAGDEQQTGDTDDGDGHHLEDAVEAVLGDAALVPLVEALGLLREEQEQSFGDGGESEGERGTGEHEAYGARAEPRQAEDDGRRRESAGEGDARGGQERERHPGDGGDGEGEVRAGIDGEGVRGGQDVAADGLQGRAGHAEGRADEESGGHPGQP